MSTYSQDLVVINGMMRGDQRIVGNREFSEDERWLYRIEPGSGAPRLTRTLPRVTMPLAPVRPNWPTTSRARAVQDHRAAVPQPHARHRWPRLYEVAAGACASACATGVVGGLGIGGTMVGAAVTSLVIALSGALFTRWFSHSPQRFRSSPASWDVGPYGRSGPCRERVDRRCRGAVVGAVGWRGSWVVGAPIHWLT